MSQRGLAVIALACLVLPLGVARATHPGSIHGWAVLGFTADSKYVYFRKSLGWNIQQEEWLAVFDATTAKQKTSQPVLRDCSDLACERGKPIGKKAGEKTAAKIHATYGAPGAGTRLAAKVAVDPAAGLRDARKAGHIQVFTADGIEVRAATKLRGKLGDPMEDPSVTASFDLELTVTARGATWTGTHRLRAQAVDDPDNGNIQRWPELYLQELAVAPDRRAAALVFARRPFVVKLVPSPVPAAQP